MPENLFPPDIYRGRISEIRKKISVAAARSGRNATDIAIVAVSKNHPPEAILAVHSAGIHIFAENYAQEFRDKSRELEQNAGFDWHFIGHLQTNKVKYLVPKVSMIHSVDSIRIAEEISKQALKNNCVIDVLLQVNTSGEASKSGCRPDDIYALTETMTHHAGIRLTGLMTIPADHENPGDSRREFHLLRELRDKLETSAGLSLPQLSMGMSHDFETAVEEGATLVRIGTAIFGERNYSRDSDRNS